MSEESTSGKSLWRWLLRLCRVLIIIAGIVWLVRPDVFKSDTYNPKSAPAKVADCKPVQKHVVKKPAVVAKAPCCCCQLPPVAAAPAPAPAPVTPAPPPPPAAQAPAPGPAVIVANIVIDDGSGRLNPPIQGPDLGRAVRIGMASGTVSAATSPMKFVVEVNGKQYTAVAETISWRPTADGTVVRALHAKIEVDAATAQAQRGLVHSWVQNADGSAVRFLNPPGNGVYRSLPDELAKLSSEHRAMMFHFVVPSNKSVSLLGRPAVFPGGR